MSQVIEERNPEVVFFLGAGTSVKVDVGLY
jgi:hypothetical protein